MVKHLKKEYKVIKITRNDYNSLQKLEYIVSCADVVINLAGANIVKRWTPKYKKVLINSRVDTTKNLVTAINRVANKPSLLISTSAVGIYNNIDIHTESSKNYSTGFLGVLAKNWEDEALKANTKIAILRFGVILGNGGILEKIKLPFKLGLGGTLGSGKQDFSFLHIEDLLRAYKHIIENENLDGTFNLVSPTHITNKVFTKTLGKVLNRPTILPVPKFVLRLALGEAVSVVAKGQKVLPQKLLESGFEFKYKTILDTLTSILGDKK
ncbi:MAG: Cell division inhibitor [uncultured Campylobacterales bacterium]|uniref:Cell division inhibitor n=1 Tax=uncultured Campylobacterales bacterium TaxID=352960 RepID=A0A6S6TIV2_9BACT|nr:MAG: Cell division inhibitor [uncultured Campylobacterales bacterium]